MFSAIFEKIKELIKKLVGTSKSIEQVLNIKPTISSEMVDAIELWGDMYQDKAPWLKNGTLNNPERVTSLGLPAFIASEKARMCTLEMQSKVTGIMQDVEDTEALTGLTVQKQEAVGDTTRADYLNEQYQNTVIKEIRKQLEYGIAKGGLVIKPYVAMSTDDQGDTTGKIFMDYIQADGFYPIAFDASGKITEAAFVQKIINKENTYSRLEYHKLEGTKTTIINKAFKSMNNQVGSSSTELGSEIPLTDVPDWATMEPEVVITNVDRLLFAYFKVPLANTIDTYSPLGVSAYSRAVNLIRDADEQYSRLLWEFEGGELAVDVDRDALTIERDSKGNDITTHTKLQNRLFRKLDMNDEQTYNVFSPALRDASLLNGLNNILMRIEDVCEMARGTLSDVNAEARTATEITVLKQRSYAANSLLQSALEDTLRDVVYIMNVYTTLYELAPDGEYDVSFEWDDSIKVDKESEMTKRLSLVMQGIDSKVSFRMWFYGETEEQALQALAKVKMYQEYENPEQPEESFTE